ncbi:GNAT family N-acetyltransferase [Candidatus Stoquefichus massiliensis]|uniref:GNAT family N-acetyltransferase n=1 Tax=Candidatus Stoquefichus massiliensis TaxID=1470350 RepID=UPI000486264A|nr:GNAT family N-acetyltransferase [Candidatus Stoquefichus massiliensis]
MNFQYSEITQSDLKKCAQLFQDAFAQDPWNETWTYEQAYMRLDELMSSKVVMGYVAYDNGILAAMILGRQMTYMDKKDLWIDELCVSKNYQGHHLGSQLLNYTKQECIKQGIHGMVLNTVKGFLSENFYQKNGFYENISLVCMSCEF